MNAVLLLRYSAGSVGAFTEYGSVAELCDGICEQYERGLKLCMSSSHAGGSRHVSYGIGELIDYLDAADSVRVLLRRGDAQWTEHDKDWTKRTLVTHLKQQLLLNNTIAYVFSVGNF